MTETFDVKQLVNDLQQKLELFLQQNKRDNPLLIGIHTGGVWVARALAGKMQLNDPLGELNINFYRDDFTRIGLHPQVKPSNIETSIDDRHVVLIDDVLHTGRTLRAALNEIFDFGRPASVTLAVLVERDGQELPVAANVSAIKLQLSKEEHIKLTGPEPLELIIQSVT